MPSRSILSIGDNHLPFFNKRSFSKILEIIKATKPYAIVDQGDKYDFISFSRFAKRQSITPADEMKEARKIAEDMWYMIHKYSPKSKLFQLKGNHDDRLRKRVLEILPEVDHLIPYNDLWRFDNVETINDSKDDLVIDGTLFTHGHRSKLGQHLKDVQYMYNVVHGHDHTLGVHFERVGALRGKIKWEASSGFIGDPFSEHLVYRPMKRYFKWTQGVLEIVDGMPRPIAFDDK